MYFCNLKLNIMRLIKGLICLLAFILLVACRDKEEKLFVNTDSSAVSDELSNQHVTAFAEDSTGYIWIGTTRGLNRYNSQNFHQYIIMSTILPVFPLTASSACLSIQKTGCGWEQTMDCAIIRIRMSFTGWAVIRNMTSCTKYGKTLRGGYS